MRMFVGIGLPEECRTSIVGALSPLAERGLPVSWTRAENLHITVKFLGEVPDARVEEMGELLAEAAGETAPFRLVVEGAGGFPTLSSPRILWAGVREPLDPVRKLHQNMEKILAGAGFPREGRPFHPHVTVGRVRRRLPAGWTERFGGSLSGIRFGDVPARSYQLYESRLSPSGSAYRVLVDVPFGGRPGKTE